MAFIRFTISTDATGEQFKEFSTSEENIQRHFARMLATAAAYTDTREVQQTVPDPTEADPAQTKVITVTESFQRPRKLGECLADMLNEIVRKVEADTLAWEQQQALAKAQEAIKPIGFEAK
jgi:hypothetical protein